MIGYINGITIYKDLEKLVVNVSGVGYDVSPTRKTLTKAKLGEPIELFIHTHVREDTLALYGFNNAESRQIFRHLISVSGVGRHLHPDRPACRLYRVFLPEENGQKSEKAFSLNFLNSLNGSLIFPMECFSKNR